MFKRKRVTFKSLEVTTRKSRLVQNGAVIFEQDYLKCTNEFAYKWNTSD